MRLNLTPPALPHVLLQFVEQGAAYRPRPTTALGMTMPGGRDEVAPDVVPTRITAQPLQVGGGHQCLALCLWNR